ncbi:MAG TPA: hypothetical protein PL148_08195 [Candidatus Aminicenantes bacterium]|nr:hypothetical protein [Candidatus Aminicenantes bacterium]HQI24119.1 hypothetical protein [Smithella sp.]
MHSIFHSQDLHGNVVINFHRNPIDELAPFARAYHEAGKRLARNLSDSSGYRDFDGYPILFLYRHSLELYLKAIVYHGAQLLHLLDAGSLDTSSLFLNHRLSSLLPAVNAVFKGLAWTWKSGVTGLNSFDEFISIVQQIEDLDRDSYSFRFPTNKKGSAALKHHTIVNPIAFALNMDPILELLDVVVLDLHEKFDASAEAIFEIQKMVRQLDREFDPT